MQVDQLPVLISIHALREEGDLAALEKQETPEPISIHALREEGDPRKAVTGGNQGVFLSTPSARRATICLGDSAGHIRHFYPRPPRGGRLSVLDTSVTATVFLSTPSARRATWCVPCNRICAEDFYPRPPRGGRLASRTLITATGRFLSTPSARRATSCPTSLM